jgi:RNA polymerase sigma factor (sigma-70 family)
MNLSDFESERPRLTAIAARITGSTVDADDVLQEAWLRVSRTELDGIVSTPAWLTTIVTRLSLDHLRKRDTRTDKETDASNDEASANAEADLDLADQIGEAMQIVLDTLAPVERAAFVLHDVFGYSFEEISVVLGRSLTAVRQLASRARRKVQRTPESIEDKAARTESRHIVDAFLVAARGGDLAVMLSLLAPDAVMHADAVGQQMGTDSTYTGSTAVAARFNGAKGAVPVNIDGDRGAAWLMAGTVKVAFVFHVGDGLITELELIADPEVLAYIDVTRARPDGS